MAPHLGALPFSSRGFVRSCPIARARFRVRDGPEGPGPVPSTLCFCFFSRARGAITLARPPIGSSPLHPLLLPPSIAPFLWLPLLSGTNLPLSSFFSPSSSQADFHRDLSTLAATLVPQVAIPNLRSSPLIVLSLRTYVVWLVPFACEASRESERGKAERSGLAQLSPGRGPCAHLPLLHCCLAPIPQKIPEIGNFN